MFFWCAACNKKDFILAETGFKEDQLPFKYLVVPIFRGILRRIHLQALANKAKARLDSW